MQHIRNAATSVTADLLRGLPPEDRVLAAWPHVCGRTVAARARAATYGNGVLRVEVEGREWNELGGLRAQYVTRLRQLTGVEVNDISFAVKRTRG